LHVAAVSATQVARFTGDYDSPLYRFTGDYDSPLYRLYGIPIKPAEQTHEGCFLGEDLDSNLCGGWFYQTMVLPDHFEEHVPMTIDFN